MLWRILFYPGLPLYFRVISLAWVLFYCWAGAWALGITYLILGVMVGAPILGIMGMDFFGTPLQESVRAISHMDGKTIFFAVEVIGSFNWYFRSFILFGLFFPAAYLFLGWGLKPVDQDAIDSTKSLH